MVGRACPRHEEAQEVLVERTGEEYTCDGIDPDFANFKLPSQNRCAKAFAQPSTAASSGLSPSQFAQATQPPNHLFIFPRGLSARGQF